MKRALLTILAALPLFAQVDVTVVNMIPRSLSNETERDAEPSVTVDPANPRRIAASAFTPDPMASGVAPIFVSTDGGATWELRPFVPGGDVTYDISLRFGGLSGVLYGGAIDSGFSRQHFLRKADFTATTPATVLLTEVWDQPWVEAATLLTGSAPDRVYFTAGNAALTQALDAASAPPPAGLTRQDIRGDYSGLAAPSTRSAVHASGRVYVVYLRFSGMSGDNRTGDVTVVRDDHWGAAAPSYRALMTGASTGVAVAAAQVFPYFDYLGSQRVGSNVAIAVDPTNRDVVYVAWGEGTSGPTQALHLRRSTDGGRTWSSDLRVIPTATNPCLAVNSQGVVGFMYQRLVGTDPLTARWETHFESSSNGFATAGTDLLLANVPEHGPGGNSIGDYANVVAVGKNFYGVFSGANTANLANFPQGVTYQRNVDWTRQRLRNVANTADVATSVDPFFFRVRMVPPSKDFYVRDWNDGLTGDDGSEPSTHPVFYETSDVWNRRGTDPGTAGPHDPPPNEPAGNGPGNIGDNWMMARIRRNAPATAGTTTVNAHFLVSEFGTGSAYSDNTTANPNLSFGPDVAVTFGAADTGPITTPPARWHLDPVMSPHLCLAVEISAPDDAYVPPSLAGQWPGWGTGTDLRILADNNRAQRNIGLSTIPARVMSIAEERTATIHNAATFTRDMELVYEVGGLSKERPVLRVDGQPVDDRQGVVLLKDMLPGENRTLTITLPGEMEVRFAERFAGVPVNGFTVAARIGSTEEVIREKLTLHRSLFTRLAALKVPGAAAEADVVRNLRLDAQAYVTLLRKRLPRFASMLPQSTSFGVQEALHALAGSLKTGDPATVAAAHSVLLHRSDAALTRARLDAGDPADVVQMVRWQRDLFRDDRKLAALPCAAELIAHSDRYLDAIGQRRITNAEYPALLKASAACLGAGGATRQQVASLFEPSSLGGQQKAHRQLLLALHKMRAP